MWFDIVSNALKKEYFTVICLFKNNVDQRATIV